MTSLTFSCYLLETDWIFLATKKFIEQYMVITILLQYRLHIMIIMPFWSQNLIEKTVRSHHNIVAYVCYKDACYSYTTCYIS